MNRVLALVVACAIAALASCSPDTPNNHGDSTTGAGGAPTTSSSSTVTGASTTTTTTTTTAGGGQGGMGGCTGASDCAFLDGPCVKGACTAGMCAPAPDQDGVTCDDGAFCTDNDICGNGTCAGTPKACPVDPGQPDAACRVGVCDEALAKCTEAPGADGATCEDGDPCTLGDACSAGVCGAGVQDDCAAFDGECGTATCTPFAGCTILPLNEGFPCAFENPCASSVCNTGRCEIVNPKNVGQPCDDGLFCSTGETCSAAGACAGGQPTCVKPAPCLESVCDEDSGLCGVKPIANGAACEDGDACTGGETCFNDVCSGGAPPATYFADDFDSGLPGWVLGAEWQIGATTASAGGAQGADPGEDHTEGPGNGVAGVSLGGNAAKTPHAMSYLESPSIDVVAATGNVVLTYYRWLDSDYTPYMRNAVEVFDGATWVTIWTTGGAPGVIDSPPTGAGWTFVSHDVTAYKNAALKVRFGFEVMSADVYAIGSWNVDDVRVLNTSCPGPS